jgi:tetratricopeptide (TPR) repeat protein
LDALVALALGEHRAGRLPEAAAAYRKILAIRPDIAEAHNNLGNVLLSQRKLDEAAVHFEHAVALRLDFAEAHNNLGFVYQWQRKLDKAATQFERAAALQPDLFQAYNNLGNVLRDQGNLDEAVARYQQALALRSDLFETHNNLGTILAQQGKLDQALARFEQAITLRPDYVEAHYNLGNVLRDQGKLDEAVARYRQVLALKPDLAEPHNNLGVIFAQQGKLDQAVPQFKQAFALRPDHIEAHNNLGNALQRQGKLDEAKASYEQALAFRPDLVEAHNNLGIVLRDLGKLDEAVARFEQALALRPNFDESLKNLGVTLMDQLRLTEARQVFQRLRTVAPDLPDAEFGLATCFLLEGDYELGWPAYESRLRMPGYVSRLNMPRWTGEPLAGRSLLLLAEQGFGDTFQFVRYARLLKERGARVVLAAQAALGRLLASSRDQHGPDWDELYILGSTPELPRADFYLPLLSAPGALGTAVSTIPGDVPYLTADSELTARWGEELAKIDGFKVGIVWQGSRDFLSDRRRSIPLAQFAPLARLAGVRLVSLQKGFGSEQVAAVDFPVVDISGRLDDAAGPFMDTAAVIRNLDLVVSPDSAIGHLAGALGAPVWLALQFSPNWRWLLDRDDSPWYPTMRLFRQTTFGGWPDVFDRIAHAVQARRSPTA